MRNFNLQVNTIARRGGRVRVASRRCDFSRVSNERFAAGSENAKMKIAKQSQFIANWLFGSGLQGQCRGWFENARGAGALSRRAGLSRVGSRSGRVNLWSHTTPLINGFGRPSYSTEN